jgi:hydroxymethylpyrimidine pyrophosphatase-like HAD family hydrolase
MASTRRGLVRFATPSKRSSRLAIPRSSIAVLGPHGQRSRHFRKAGVSIAMGNASTEVQRQADYVTASNADAIERSILDEWRR